MLPSIIASGWKKVHSHIKCDFVFKGVLTDQYNTRVYIIAQSNTTF
jgi:hypothetical protein